MSSLTELTKPFAAEDLEWRLQSSGSKNGRIWGRCLCYINNRAIQQRLDEVVGVENWRNEYREITPIDVDGTKISGVMCGISIRIKREDGTAEWITKWDGSENTDIESVKGGLSGAMKRAAVQWGIGRYLYALKDNWATVTEKGIYTGKTKEGEWFKWNPPALPAWALPSPSNTTVTSTSTPAIPATTSATSTEVDALIIKVNEFIHSGVLQGGYATKASGYIEQRNATGLQNVVAYCNSLETKKNGGTQ